MADSPPARAAWRSTLDLLLIVLGTGLAFWLGYAYPRLRVQVRHRYLLHPAEEFRWPDTPAKSGTFDAQASLPEGMTWDPQAKQLTWQPTLTQTGDYDVEVRERSLTRVVTHRLALSVIAADRPPVFSQLPATTFPQGTTYTSEFVVTDPEGQPVDYRLASKLPGMHLDLSTPVPKLVWAPPFVEAGEYPVTIEAWDGSNVVTHQFLIAVPALPWTEERQVTVENPAKQPLSDLQIAVEVRRQPGMREDFGDLRFEDPDGKPLAYWCETDSGDVTAAWVRLPALPADGTTLRLRFGNLRAPPGSDGNAVFPFFDDFSNGFDSRKWLRNRNAADGGVGAFVDDGILHVYGGDGNAPGWVKSKIDLPTQLEVMGRWKVERLNDYARGGWALFPKADFNRIRSYHDGLTGIEFNYFSYQGTPTLNPKSFFPLPPVDGVALEPYWQNRWFRQALSYDGTRSEDNVLFRRDDGETAQQLRHSAPRNEQPLRLLIMPWAWYPRPTHRYYLDWIAVRTWLPREPVVRVTGNE